MAKKCPHCNHDIPPGMEVMPVCVMCGGDINAQPTQTWTTLDIQNQQSFACHACGTSIASVLTTECPSCGVALELAKTSEVAPEPVAPAPEPVAPAPEPVAPAPEPVAPAPEPVAPAPEPVAPAPEPVAPSKPVQLPDFVGQEKPSAPEPVTEAPQKQPAAAPEGFFAKLLRMLGFKK